MERAVDREKNSEKDMGNPYLGGITTKHRTTANFFCTLMHAVGKPRDTFGVADPGLRDLDQSGVVAELLA